MARYFGEHMARLHAATSSRPEHNTDDANERDETDALMNTGYLGSIRPAQPRHVSEFITGILYI